MKYVDYKSLPNARTDRRQPAWHWLLGSRLFVHFRGQLLPQRPFSFDDIHYLGRHRKQSGRSRDRLGRGLYRAASPRVGICWDGAAHGNNMLSAIVAADPRLYAKLGGTAADPAAVYGLGYDANNDGEFGLNDDTAFDSLGFAFTTRPIWRPRRTRATTTPKVGSRACGTTASQSSNPYTGGQWSDTQVAWPAVCSSMAPGIVGRSHRRSISRRCENPVAAAPPFPPGDFDHDGQVTARPTTACGGRPTVRPRSRRRRERQSHRRCRRLRRLAPRVLLQTISRAVHLRKCSRANDRLLIASSWFSSLIRRKKKVHAEAWAAERLENSESSLRPLRSA